MGARGCALAMAAVAAVLPTEVKAQDDPYCVALWVTRNAIMDRVGHCFATPLGAALFDNSDCTVMQGRVSPADAADLFDIQAMEDSAGCRVDSGAAPDAFAEALAARFRELSTIPVPNPHESACIGYTGPPLRLYRGPGAEGDVLFTLVAGQSVHYSHMPVDGWEYVTIHAEPGQALVGHGWQSPDDAVFPNCTMAAG